MRGGGRCAVLVTALWSAVPAAAWVTLEQTIYGTDAASVDGRPNRQGAWVTWDASTPLRWAFGSEVCDRYVGTALPAGTDCRDVRVAARRAVHGWERMHTGLRFLEDGGSDSGDAVDVSFTEAATFESAFARAGQSSGAAVDALRVNATAATVALASLSILPDTAGRLWIRSARVVLVRDAVVNWCPSVADPFLAATQATETGCVAFATLLAHEFGHVLGLGHPDQPELGTNTYSAALVPTLDNASAGAELNVTRDWCEAPWSDTLPVPASKMQPSVMKSNLAMSHAIVEPTSDDLAGLLMLYPPDVSACSDPAQLRNAVAFGPSDLAVPLETSQPHTGDDDDGNGLHDDDDDAAIATWNFGVSSLIFLLFFATVCSFALFVPADYDYQYYRQRAYARAPAATDPKPTPATPAK